MSDAKNDRKDAERETPPSTEAKKTERAEKPQPKQGLDYVFKISPVDPKNSSSFEDVADK
jgi:hypothetical protein